jgi:hypothetical protein
MCASHYYYKTNNTIILVLTISILGIEIPNQFIFATKVRRRKGGERIAMVVTAEYDNENVQEGIERRNKSTGCDFSEHGT